MGSLGGRELMLLVDEAAIEMERWGERVFGKGSGRGEKTEESESEGEGRDGELGKHIGYAGSLKKEIEFDKSKEENVEKAGAGQLGLIMLDLEWNSREMGKGYSELAKPGYDKKLWDGKGGLFEPPTLRGICDMAMTIVGKAIGGVGGMLLGFVDDLLFAGLDVTGRV